MKRKMGGKPMELFDKVVNALSIMKVEMSNTIGLFSRSNTSTITKWTFWKTQSKTKIKSMYYQLKFYDYAIGEESVSEKRCYYPQTIVQGKSVETESISKDRRFPQ